MRQSNVSSTPQNQACLLITSRLYDRRGLDCTSPLPLFNSLAHLTHLTATSPKIREILTRDGGLERLVRILRDFCASPPSAHSPTFFYGLLPPAPHPKPTSTQGHDREAAFRFSLAFQCVVNIGVRGSESIRARVVQAGTLDVVGALLEAWLASRGFPIGPMKRPRRSKDIRETPANGVGPAHPTTLIAPPMTAQHHHRDRAATIVAPRLQQAPISRPTPANAVASTSTVILHPNTTALRTRSGAITPNTNGSNSGANTETESDADADMEVDTRPPTDNEALAPPRRRVAIVDQDEIAMDVDNIGMVIIDPPEAFEQPGATPDDVMPTPRATLANLTGAGDTDATTAAEDADQVPASPSAVTPTAGPGGQRPPINSRGLSNGPQTQDTGPFRQEDVLRSLQLLAYLTKYPHVRQEFYQPRIYPTSTTGANLPGAPPGLAGLSAFSTLPPRGGQPAPSPVIVPALAKGHKGPVPSSPTVLFTTLFSLVERFTFRPSSSQSSPSVSMPTIPAEIQSWAAVIMRNACRKDDSKGGVRQCANMLCGRWETVPREFAKCRRCRKAKYCGKDCQSRAWAMGHRYWCSARDGEEGDADAGEGEDGGGHPPGASNPMERTERRERARHQLAALTTPARDLAGTISRPPGPAPPPVGIRARTLAIPGQLPPILDQQQTQTAQQQHRFSHLGFLNPLFNSPQTERETTALNEDSETNQTMDSSPSTGFSNGQDQAAAQVQATPQQTPARRLWYSLIGQPPSQPNLTTTGSSSTLTANTSPTSSNVTLPPASTAPVASGSRQFPPGPRDTYVESRAPAYTYQQLLNASTAGPSRTTSSLGRRPPPPGTSHSHLPPLPPAAGGSIGWTGPSYVPTARPPLPESRPSATTAQGSNRNSSGYSSRAWGPSPWDGTSSSGGIGLGLDDTTSTSLGSSSQDNINPQTDPPGPNNSNINLTADRVGSGGVPMERVRRARPRWPPIRPGDEEDEEESSRLAETRASMPAVSQRENNVGDSMSSLTGGEGTIRARRQWPRGVLDEDVEMG